MDGAADETYTFPTTWARQRKGRRGKSTTLPGREWESVKYTLGRGRQGPGGGMKRPGGDCFGELTAGGHPPRLPRLTNPAYHRRLVDTS